MVKKENNNCSLILNDEEIKNIDYTYNKIVIGERNINSYFKFENGYIYLYLDEVFLKKILGNLKGDSATEEKEEFEKILKTKVILKDNKVTYKYEVLKPFDHIDEDSKLEYFNEINNSSCFVTKINENNIFKLNSNKFIIDGVEKNISDLNLITTASKNIEKIFDEDLDIYKVDYIGQQPLGEYLILKTL